MITLVREVIAKSKPGNWRYDIVEAGYKMNMTDIMASIGLVELERYNNDTLPKREAIYEQYTVALSKQPWAIIPEYKNNNKITSYHLYALRIKGASEQQRDQIISKIFEKQVSVNVHFIPVPMTSFYTGLGYNVHDYPKTFSMYENEISLPVFYDLSEEQVKQVIEAVCASVNEVMGS